MTRPRKHHRIRIRGSQREDIDADLMAQLVVLLGKQLAREAAGEGREETGTAECVDLAGLLAAEERSQEAKAPEMPRAEDDTRQPAEKRP